MQFLGALLFAAATAQPIVGPEIPLVAARHISLYAPTPIAIAPAGAGFVFAWGEEQSDTGWRVGIATADANGTIVGPRVMQPASPLSRYAADPSIAQFGDGFLIAWTEDCGQLAPACGVLRRLDAALNTTAEYPSLPVRSVLKVSAFGNQAVLVSGKQMWHIAADGSLSAAELNNEPFDAAAVNASGAVAVASHHFEGSGYPFCICGGISDVSRVVTFAWPGAALRGSFADVFRGVLSENLSPPFNPLPALASNGCCFVMAWTDQPRNFQRSVMAAVFHAPSEVLAKMNAPARLAFLWEDVQPSVASDGERYLVVWPSFDLAQGKHDIAGVVINADETMQQIAIAAAPADETEPAVAALGPGRFVVVYDNGTRTVARFVELTKPRQRAVR